MRCRRWLRGSCAIAYLNVLDGNTTHFVGMNEFVGVIGRGVGVLSMAASRSCSFSAGSIFDSGSSLSPLPCWNNVGPALARRHSPHFYFPPVAHQPIRPDCLICILSRAVLRPIVARSFCLMLKRRLWTIAPITRKHFAWHGHKRYKCYDYFHEPCLYPLCA